VADRDRSYGVTVVVGLAGAVLTAVAGTRPWARAATGDAAGIDVDAAVRGSDSAPLVAALALVGLAAWGVLLVLRGRMRRVIAMTGSVACLGALLAVVDAFDGAQNDALASLRDRGAAGDVAVASLTAWYYVAGVAALTAALAFAVAVWKAPHWPEMGTRYDAPSTQASVPVTDEDMWRALDHGHDPTS